MYVGYSGLPVRNLVHRILHSVVDLSIEACNVMTIILPQEGRFHLYTIEGNTPFRTASVSVAMRIGPVMSRQGQTEYRISSITTG